MSWHTTYRPTKFGEMALYPELRTWLEMYEATGEFDHLLFYGDVGTGKTTAAYILANAVMDDFSVDRNVIDCADRPGIQEFKSNVVKIGHSTSGLVRFMSGNNREVYILDEFHKLPNVTQTTLNAVLEKDEGAATCIFCVNDINEVEKPIVSRTQTLRFDIGFYDEPKDKLDMHNYVDCSIDEWKEELRRIGRIVCKKHDVEPDKEIEDIVLSNDSYATEVRAYIRALEKNYQKVGFYEKK